MKQNTNKRIVAINECDFGSTGSIAISVLNKLKNEGYKTLLVCHESKQRFDDEYIINKNKLVYLKNKILSRIDASDGFHSHDETKKLVKYLSDFKPDCLLLNNLHGSYINIPVLFDYIKSKKIKCIWTLHDCWAFTGKCAYFSYAHCEKWKTECNHCKMLHSHPRAYFFDNSKKLFNIKKKLFEGLENLITFVSTSKWSDDFLEHSYLKNFKHLVICNGIKTNVMAQQPNSGYLINKNEKRIILFSCAMPLCKEKGLHFINKLADELDPNKYLFLCAGVDPKEALSKNIINLGFIENKEELNYYYKNADYFLNPSFSDTFGLTNIESLALGTPVIIFKDTGCASIVSDECSFKANFIDYQSLKTIVLSLEKKLTTVKEKCIKNASNFKIENMQDKYANLIKETIN